MSAPGNWDDAPCALLTLDRQGTVLRANRTFLAWVGRTAGEVEQTVTLSSLLSAGGRIYWETHLSPLLHVEGRVDEIALELRGSDQRLPVLLTAVAGRGSDVVHVALSSARDRSRYEREVLAARTAAERSAGQLHALQETTAALSRAVGIDSVIAALLDAAVGPLGAAAATLWLQEPDRQPQRYASRGESLDSAELPAAGLVLHERAGSPHDGRVVLPLHGHARLHGVLSLRARDGAADDPLDLDLLRGVGQQAGLALDRAQLHEQSASVARELQHSLLAVAPPDDARFDVATVYRPGVELLEVGGDWYDLFLAEPDVLAVVVGDVVGRGLGAASAMGQLRSAVRAVAGPDVGPARLLSRLDHFVEQVEAASMATVAYAELDLATGAVRYACAGHPPPLLLPADGEPRLLWEGRSTPLGGFVQRLGRSEATLDLQAGDRLLLFTDGLFERRDRELDEGLDVLARAAERVRALPLGDAVASLTQTLLRDESTRDDVCVLLLSWRGPQFDRSLPADLSTLSAVRHELDGWLRRQRIETDVRADLVLAASEAMANAGEHGSGSRPTELVSLTARVLTRDDLADEVVLSIRDSGRWRSPASSHERGRGLQIIAGLVDDVTVSEDHGTTVELRRRLQGRAS